MQKPAKWNYTAEDFLESTTPYEELEKCNGDPFLQQRMIEAMSKYAASIGFRGLKLMYKRYQQSIRASRGAYIAEHPTNGNRRGKERSLPVRIRSFLSNGW